MTDFGIYVHWPFCAAKCPYCDFNSHVRPQIDEAQWLRLIGAELRSIAGLQDIKPIVTSVFFGGGTPSLMSSSATKSVLAEIARLWPIQRDAEITLEANPNSVEQNRFHGYRAAGVNRVLIGVQSLNDMSLRQLGRLHDSAEAKSAIALATNIFPRVSFDLIYARPDQTLDDWKRELQQAFAFGTEHISVYQLTIESGTAFASLYRQGKLKLPDEDIATGFYELTQELCENAGLPAYEISNHARPDCESRHNLLYWRYGDYAGAGPGAHGRLTLAGRRIATDSERLPERWASRIAAEGRGFSLERIEDHDAAREHLLMNLRISEGIDLAAFALRWGLVPSPQSVGQMQQMGLIAQSGSRISATRQGRLVLNRVVVKLRIRFRNPSVGKSSAPDHERKSRLHQCRDRKATLRRAVRVKAENPVNPGETIWIGERRIGKPLMRWPIGQKRYERQCIVGECRDPRRCRAIYRPVMGHKTGKGIWRWGREPSILQHWFVGGRSVVPQSGAQKLRPAVFCAGNRERRRNRLEHWSTLGDEDSVGPGLDRLLGRGANQFRPLGKSLNVGDPAACTHDGIPECTIDLVAIRRIRDQGGKIAVAGLDRIAHDPADFGFRLKTEEINASSAH